MHGLCFCTVIVDQTAPTLVLSSTSPTITSSSSVTVTFTFSEDVSAFSASSLTLTTSNSDISVGYVNKVSSSQYTVTVEGANSAEGAFTLTVKGNTVTDLADNFLTDIPATSFTIGVFSL